MNIFYIFVMFLSFFPAIIHCNFSCCCTGRSRKSTVLFKPIKQDESQMEPLRDWKAGVHDAEQKQFGRCNPRAEK